MENETHRIRIIGLKDGNVKWIDITEDGRWVAAGGAGKAGSWTKDMQAENQTFEDICHELGIKTLKFNTGYKDNII